MPPRSLGARRARSTVFSSSQRDTHVSESEVHARSEYARPHWHGQPELAGQGSALRGTFRDPSAVQLPCAVVPSCPAESDCESCPVVLPRRDGPPPPSLQQERRGAVSVRQWSCGR